ncbi:urea carboxylase [Motilibacter rhizosphaerae]|uniref:Urea carboxylase n=1 Tax=Motilibacter rhizosphaerae TaxID=598652 RepID=A0A4Q7NR07_9ACTN|nr:urea carboxylase [Motilibacter rhizosphaerae]RZS87548.1 urea carboxylase [Motilibacter rhizosphaerae]
MTFDTLLVANRGEIACRIQRTAKRLGLKTVAVFSDPDRSAPHVRMADVAVRLGPAPSRESYLRTDAILDAALANGVGAIHPGYGFLSEDASFARVVEAAGIVFVGPTPEQLEAFGAKHTARALAAAAGVPMIEGTDLLPDVAAALEAAGTIGYPVMLKATGGGGGIGMQVCRDAAELADAYARVERMAAASFASSGVFLERFVERARHVEVQVLGDGLGGVVVLGDRDCSLQRRNQKVLEEAPAPNLPDAVRQALHGSAAALAASVRYRSAGTVEFVYDAEREVASFLEVNARLQVEHPVTEEVFGVDLVEKMLRLAQGETGVVQEPLQQSGFAVEARVYAEDPTRGHQPSAGLVTNVSFPDDVRVDGWVEAGTEVTTAYDPMLAKVIATGSTREEAFARLREALVATRVDGIETNLGLLRASLADEDVLAARHSTSTLGGIDDAEPRIVVERAGTQTAVQDWPGRAGLWEVGVPPSGPMDDLSFRLGNRALGNPEGAPGLECAVDGPALRFTSGTTVCITGAPVTVTVDGVLVPQWEPVDVPAGATLDVGRADGPGLRVYVLVAGGLDVPAYLGSASTFTLGQFGGHGGRNLRLGDVLRAAAAPSSTREPVTAPTLTHAWEIGVVEGPHAAPTFFTDEDIATFYATSFEVHFNSARTGVRLVGPKPQWARTDGGEAGLHPSNIHDTPYSVGAVDFTGDTPILLGPDGPSLGGFVCPATVVTGERWKLGQLRPGDTVRFVPVAEQEARRLRASPATSLHRTEIADQGVIGAREESAAGPSVTYRRSGDDNLLVEYGPMALDLGLRMRVHALMDRLRSEGAAGIVDLTPGIRSLQVKLDPDRLSVRDALALVRGLEDELPATSELVVPSRTVHLPLSWDDPATREAIQRYMAGVRDDAPWCPWNIEFIRRVNGLDSVDDVYRTVFDASYLVLGLGDVYLGAPVATPLDPRHRLVTTKYNPARTWTPENAVGIGGAYLCIYGMEGPGGYQFVGRTTQVWSRFRQGGGFEAGSPWLLRHFDRISWYPVSAEELLDLRADTAAGRHDVRIDDGSFALADYEAFLADNAGSIAEFRAQQAEAFGAERDAWAAAGEFDPRPEPPAPPAAGEVSVPAGGSLVEAPFTSSVWRVDVRPGDRVRAGSPLLALEAMKLETVVPAPHDAEVVDVLVTPGTQVTPGAPLVVLGSPS